MSKRNTIMESIKKDLGEHAEIYQGIIGDHIRQLIVRATENGLTTESISAFLEMSIEDVEMYQQKHTDSYPSF